MCESKIALSPLRSYQHTHIRIRVHRNAGKGEKMIFDYKGVSLRITVPRDVTEGCVLRVRVPFRAIVMIDACHKIQAAVRKHVLSSPRTNEQTPQEVARRWVLSEQ